MRKIADIIRKPLVSNRAAGDAARDARDWAAAETFYRSHLSVEPSDVAIWVQLGHSLGEQGKSKEAEDAYRKATAVDPNDADSRFHLGQSLKKTGRRAEAYKAFSESFAIDPTKDAMAGMESCAPHGAPSPGTIEDKVELQTSAVLIEIDDLLGYLHAHRTVSGIQRVQVAVIQHVLATEGINSSLHRFILNPPESNGLWLVRGADLAELVDYVTGPAVDHSYLRDLIEACRGHATAVSPRSGQAYLVLGAFWGYGGLAARYASLRRAGVKIGVYVYDLIPITHPEYCDDRLSHDFSLSVADAIACFDFILTISEFTASQVRHYLRANGLANLPVAAVPLAHSDALHHTSPPEKWGPAISHLRERSFALMVSTIEARKNHAYLVAAWKQLIDEGLDPPDLVFVGRQGWRVSGLMDALVSLDYLGGRVHLVHDLSDRDLSTLYSACLFTLFPSFVEGWGLPVGEGLAHGRPCVASSTSSIPEVGGDLVDYIDPLNIRDGLAAIRKMAFDEDYRNRRAEEVKLGLKLRDWGNVGADLLSCVAKVLPTLPNRSLTDVAFASGSLFRPSDLVFGRPVPKDYPRHPLRMMLVDGWYGPENFGSWMRGSKGVLRFTSSLPAGSPIVIYIQLVAPHWATPENVVSVEVADPNTRPARTLRAHSGTPLRPDSPKMIRAIGLVGSNGTVLISISVSGHVPRENNDAPGGRRFVVGLKAIGYAARSDAAGRLDVQDAITFS